VLSGVDLLIWPALLPCPVLSQQHINNLTLLAMNRPPQAHTKGLLHKLRDNIPGLALRTTFITGGWGGWGGERVLVSVGVGRCVGGWVGGWVGVVVAVVVAVVVVVVV